MEQILREIEAALAAKLYFLALAMVLSLPDVCAALESKDGQTSGKRYQRWYRKHLASRFPWLSAQDCYSLRCGVVHQGRFGHGKMKYGRVLFTLPSNLKMTGCVIDDAYVTDAENFCRSVIAGIRKWFESAKGDPMVKSNMPNLVEIRPQGLAPYIIGAPLIA